MKSQLNRVAPSLIFWTIFAFLMGFGLPILIHSQQGDWKYQYDSSANLAFFYLGLGLFLWLLIIYLFSKNFLFRLIRQRKELLRLKDEGKRIKAKIKRNILQGQNAEGKSLILDLEFTNLAGAVVDYSLELFDSRPDENRFTEGKDLSLVVGGDPKSPNITAEIGTISFNKGIMTLIVLSLAVIILTPIGLLVYGYLYESQGQGWRYLTFWHPFIIAPIFGSIYLLVMLFIVGLTTKRENSTRLLIYGKSTDATIVSAAETGLSINDKPQIQVQVEFQHQGQTIQASYRRIYSLLNLARIQAGNVIKIIYDAEDPNFIEPNE